MKRLHETILTLYWCSCQYPWHTIVNVSLASVFYLFASHYGHSLRIIFFRELFLLTTTGDSSHFFYFVLDIAIPYVLFSIIIILILVFFVLHKGIVYNVLGYTFFYWFLFFPVHLLFGVTKNEVWTQPFTFPIVMVAILLIAFFVSALFYFPYRIRKVYLAFKSVKIKEKVRIVHLSDIHAENYGSREISLISLASKLNPDIILISGDTFIVPVRPHNRGFNATIKVVEQLPSKYGIYIVEGHHDTGKIHHIAGAAKNRITLLNNEWSHFNKYGITLSIFGATLYSRKSNLNRCQKPNNFRIFFAHDPALMRNLKSGDVDLALFGHTHASQVYLPIISSLIVGQHRHGRYEYNGTPIYVNAGIGLEGYLSPRIRWFTFPEVVVIDLLPTN